MATARTRREFTPEFKRETVVLITEQGYTMAKAAQAVDDSERRDLMALLRGDPPELTASPLQTRLRFA